jgi:protein-S-isoprenylcysteine O-methyltransferase Ste14
MITNEQLFRWFFIAISISTLSISGYFRRKARQSGEVIPRAREGKLVLLSRLLFSAPLYLPIIAFMLNPAWMAWSAISIPIWLRWLDVAVGLGMLPLIYWVVSSIGNNISETFLTKENPILVTHGPYHWVRHPLYTVATIWLISLSILGANWFMLAMTCLAFMGLAVPVIPREETELRRNFGNKYQDYMKRTGRFVPRLYLFEKDDKCGS